MAKYCRKCKSILAIISKLSAAEPSKWVKYVMEVQQITEAAVREVGDNRWASETEKSQRARRTGFLRNWK